MTIATFACPDHPESTWRAPVHRLLGLVGQRQVTLDVLVAIGVLRYGLDKRIDQVQRILDRRGIHLSRGHLSRLGVEFLVRWHALFDRSRRHWAPRLRRGLILLIDGTSDGGGPVTYRAIVARTGVTVHAATIASEKEGDLVAFLKEVKREVGRPRLILRDGSPAARNACTRVFPGVPQALCHWHFLRGAGEALLKAAYERLRTRILATKELARLETLRKRLVEACASAADPRRRSLRVAVRLQLEDVLSARDATGGVPFHLAYFEVALAVRAARARFKGLVEAAYTWNVHEPLLLEAKQRLDALWDAKGVLETFLSVERRWDWFLRMRSWFRLEEAASGRPVEPDSETKALDAATVASRMHSVRAEAEAAGAQEAAAWMRVVSRFAEHEAELFPQVRLKNPPRTTSQLEYAHRGTRRRIRRRTGTLATRLEMERLGPHLAVWDNAFNAWFARHALSGVDVVAAFLDQDAGVIEQGVAAVAATRLRDRLPVKPRNRGVLLDEFAALVSGQAPVEVLTAWADRVEGVTSPEV